MTKEQIEKKAREIASKYVKLGFKNRYNHDQYDAAMEMAEWLLTHQWVSVEDELPPQIGRYSHYVIMRSRIGGHYTGCYDFVAKKWLDGRLEDILMDITHWMPIPPMAEKGGNNK